VTWPHPQRRGADLITLWDAAHGWGYGDLTSSSQGDSAAEAGWWGTRVYRVGVRGRDELLLRQSRGMAYDYSLRRIYDAPRRREILQSSPEMPPVLSKAEFEAKINRVARQYSRMRKSEKLMDADALDYMVHSSWAEMTSDWRNAVIFWLERLTTREMALGELHPDCYAYFEGVWLDDVKEHRAYFRWLGVRAEEYWTPPHLRDRHYFIACEELRDDLINEGVKERTSSFPEAKAYIRQKCLAEGGGFSLQKCGDLIARKEKRIRGSVASARTVAETFTKTTMNGLFPQSRTGTAKPSRRS
jgi:hypothetical protein